MQSAKVAASSKSGKETETYFQTAVRRISIIYQAAEKYDFPAVWPAWPVSNDHSIKLKCEGLSVAPLGFTGLS